MAFYTTIFLRVCAGLGNRLRALVSGLCAAEDIGRNLVVCWPIEHGCGAAWKELFDSSDLPDWVTIQTVEFNMGLEECLTQENWDAIPKDGPIEIKSHGQFHRTDEGRWLRWLRRLRPKKEILEAVNTIFRGQIPMGIHLRRTDNIRAIELSPTRLFVEKMAAQLEKTLFWLATDDEKERLEMERKFGGQIIRYRPGTLSRGHLQGVKGALIEFIGLSRCSTIFATVSSSFSEMAAAYGGCRLEIIR